MGQGRVRIWNDLLFQKAPGCPFRVTCVARSESKATRRLPRLIGLAWVGEDPPEETTWWPRGPRRSAIDHEDCFAKQRLLPALAWDPAKVQPARTRRTMERLAAVDRLVRAVAGASVRGRQTAALAKITRGTDAGTGLPVDDGPVRHDGYAHPGAKTA